MYEWAKSYFSGRNLTIIIVITFLLLAGCWFAYCIRIRNVHDDGSGVAGVGNQIGQAESNINNAASGIETAHGHADQVASGIESAKESANYIQGTANTSAGIISECQQILAGIRKRGKTETSKN